MRKVLLLSSVLVLLGFGPVGCLGGEFVLQDEQQLENLEVIKESYEHIYDSLADKRIPADAVLDSHKDLVSEAYELEKAKQQSWEEWAKENGWKPPGTE